MESVDIVIPVYNEEASIIENVKTISEHLPDNGMGFSFILVDDGSTDNTWDKLKDIEINNTKIKAFRFSKNFGKENALLLGISKSFGDATIVLDSDLQHPPSLIPELIKLWKDFDYDIIEAVKNTRPESRINKLLVTVYHSILTKISGINLKNSSDFKLMSKSVREEIVKLNEYHFFFRAIVEWIGYKKMKIYFDVADREGGESKFNFRSLINLAINGVTSFSSAPLRIISYLGILTLLISFVFGVITLVQYAMGIALGGFSTVILLILIIGSIQMLSLGILGLYIAKIFDQSKMRPRYIVKEEF